jgi:phospholipase D1/2
MEEKSGIRFHEAQVALARQWIGEQPPAKEGEWRPTEVDIRIPTESEGAGLVATEKKDVKTEKVKIPENEHEARRIIEQFENSAQDGELQQARGVSDNVVQHMLHDVTHLNEEAWHGSPEEELQWSGYFSSYVTCQLMSYPATFLNCSTSTQKS